MKKTLQTAVYAVAILTGGQAFALSVNLFNLGTASGQGGAASWVANLGGSEVMLETFDGGVGFAGEQGVGGGWYTSLTTGVGTFEAKGTAGAGATSYNGTHNPDSLTPYFQMRDQGHYGRENQTLNGQWYLDSGDITDLTLAVEPGLSNLFFYLQDPSDCGAMTVVSAKDETTVLAKNSISPNQRNGSLWFVGISSEKAIDTVTWKVGSNGDGYGLDDFGTVAAPVPEPRTMLLLGTGLLGLAGYGRRRTRAGAGA